MEPTDQDALALTHALALQESGSGGKPNYSATGDAGTSKGAYQWQPGNFEAAAKAAGLDPNDFSPKNQDKVAYSEVKGYKDKGYDPGQIASLWNSGSPNNWQNHSGTTTINGKQIHYDTPAYVNGVKKYYQQIKGSSAQTYNPTPFSNPTGGNPGTFDVTGGQGGQSAEPQQPEGLGSKILGAVKGVANAAFPIAGDLYNDVTGNNDKTALQQLGDTGLSALWFLPFGEIAEGASAGARAIGIGADAAKTAGNIATGVGTGYAADVAGNASQGQTGADTLKPGLGTVLGGAAPVAGEALGGLYNKFRGQQSTLDKVQGAYEDALGATKTGVRASSKVSARGQESPAEFLAHAGLPPETEEVNGRQIFTTGEDSNTYKTIQQRASDLTKLRDQAIEQAPGVSSIESLRNEALKKAEGEFLGTDRDKAIEHINTEFDKLKEQFGGQEEIPIKDLNRIKMQFQGGSKYDATQPSVITKTNRIVGNLAKTQVENDAEKAGVKGLGKLNKIIQQHLDFLNTDGKKGILHKLNGQVVKGGRIGTHVKEAIGGAIGLAANNALGGGLLGDVAGGIGGAAVGNMVSRWMQKLAVGGSVTAATLGRMAKEDPEVVQEFLKLLDREGEQVAPNVKAAQETAAGLVRRILKKSPGSAILRVARKP